MPSILSILLAGFSVLALTACGTVVPTDTDVRQAHPIMVERRPAELLLIPGPDGKLSAADALRVKDFVDAWRDRGRGPLRVSTPGRLESGARDKLLAQLAGLVSRRGASVANILPFTAFDGSAGVNLGFDDFIAVGPSCAPESAVLSFPRDNVQTPAFGCATQRNIAAMVAHPADLIDPATSLDASAARGSLVIQNHRLGNPTASQAGSDKGVVVSNVIR